MSEITAESVRESLAALSAPLREQLSQVEEALSKQEAEVKRLRELRSEIRGALVRVDPSYVHPSTPFSKNGGKKKNEISSERVEQILGLLRSNESRLPDEGFTATTLERMFPGVSQSTYAKALNVLHDRGDIRLDHRGRGGANYWKLVG